MVYIMQVRMINRVKNLEKSVLQEMVPAILGSLPLQYFQDQTHQKIQGPHTVSY
jgi:hypothetical protein